MSGPAQSAGMQVGDVITEVDGRQVTTGVDFIVTVRSKNVGDTVNVVVQRAGKPRTLRLTLAAAG